jgi:hypothetical protein
MARFLRPRLVIPIVGLLLLLAAGVYYDPLDLFAPKVTGTITKLDLFQELQSYGALGSVRLIFIPTDGGKTRVASVNTGDLTFNLLLPPGRYRVGVEIITIGDPPQNQDQLASMMRVQAIDHAKEVMQFLSVTSGALTCEVTSARDQSVEIDLAKGLAAARSRERPRGGE